MNMHLQLKPNFHMKKPERKNRCYSHDNKTSAKLKKWATALNMGRGKVIERLVDHAEKTNFAAKLPTV